MLQIKQPSNNDMFPVDSSVLFKGTTDSAITKIEILADGRWPLPSPKISGGQWSVNYAFTGAGDRKIVVMGYDANNNLVDSESVRITVQNKQFGFPPPTSGNLGDRLDLWATFYYVHSANNGSGDNDLLDVNGKKLGATLSDRDWCKAALEGTVCVKSSNGKVKTFNFAGRSDNSQVNCRPFFPSLNTIEATNRSCFSLAKGAFGDGVDGLKLVPYRSIAVDRTDIPIGTVIYIPEARGVSVTLSDGKKVLHDGYFYAADVGGAIKDNHIDIFLGLTENNPFPFVTSDRNDTFTAFTIDNPAIKGELGKAHA
jgi:3D (Asp-Asp-Asp) domain-containing protein